MIHLMNITFIFGICRSILAAVTPAKYECDCMGPTCTFAKVENGEINGHGFSNPHPSPWCVIIHYAIISSIYRVHYMMLPPRLIHRYGNCYREHEALWLWLHDSANDKQHIGFQHLFFPHIIFCCYMQQMRCNVIGKTVVMQWLRQAKCQCPVSWPHHEYHDDIIKWKHFPRYWPFARNSPVPGEFPAQRPVTRSFDIFFDLLLNKRLSK